MGARLETASEFCSPPFSRYHKNRQEFADINVNTANAEQLINYIVNFAPDYLGLDDPDLFVTENGDRMSAADLRQIIEMSVPPPPTRVQLIARLRNCRIEWTAPYFPEAQPMEKWNNNLKWSYRYEFEVADKGPNVAAAVRMFAEACDDEAAERWVKATDTWCLQVLNREPGVLSDLEMAALPPI